MSACALVVAFLLSGQVSAPEDRYGAGGSSPPNSATNGQRASSESDIFAPLQPLSGEQATDGSEQPSQPAGGSQSPYAGRASQPAAGQPSITPNGVSPPPFRNLQTQPSGTPPATSSTSPATGLKPIGMMRAMLTAPPNSQLTGRSVELVEVVAGANSRLEQTERVEAYWDLCSAVADYYLGLREQEELRRLKATARGNSPAWQQAEEELAVRMNTSLKAARASQMRLAAWTGGTSVSLPLPADQPHCGNYHSRYDEVFAGRPNAEAKQLSEVLPLRYAELKGAAAAVPRAEELLNGVARSETGDGSGTLRALEFLALRRRAFVQIARDYNRRIARYVELASPGEIGPDRLIGMLIKTDNAATATRPASANETRRQSNDDTGMPPRTFANTEGWEPADERAGTAIRDEAVQQTSGTSPPAPSRERSLLVTPRE